MAAGFSLFINVMLLGPVLYMLQVFDRVLTSRSLSTLFMLTVIVVVALVAMTVVDWVRARLLMIAGTHLDDMAGGALLQSHIESSLKPGAARQTWVLRDLATVRSFLSGANVIALFDTPWLVVFLVIIGLFHPWLGLMALAGSLLLLGLAWTNERVHRRTLEQIQDETRRASAWMATGLRNVDVLNSMGMTRSFVAQWQRRNQALLTSTKNTHAGLAGIVSLGKLVRQGIQVAMLALGVYLVIHEHLSPGVMIASTVLLGRAMAPVESLIGNWTGLTAARTAWQRLRPALDALDQPHDRQPLPPLRGQIDLQKVSLATPGGHVLLKPLDLSLPAGKSLALLGPSGSGKTSLARLLAGACRPASGVIRFDGADVEQWDPAPLAAGIGYLPQDVELFPGTVAENIGRLSVEDREGILDAARAAHVTELILRLPQGFDTPLGDDGIRLSAGQAQRIALARALYGRPAILVLDEPNASLDAAGEDALTRVLREQRASGVTIVMVTHKPSLVGDMDYMLVLREGAAEMMGPAGEVVLRLSPLAARREQRA
jgi:PrtD family type I secretion system ABC transporter